MRFVLNYLTLFLSICLIILSLFGKQFIPTNFNTGKTTAIVGVCIGTRPVLESIGDLTAYANHPFYYDANAFAGNDSVLFYDDSPIFDIGESDGVIDFTPTDAQVGSYNIIITSNNSVCKDLGDYEQIVFTVSSGVPPVQPPAEVGGGAAGGKIVTDFEVQPSLIKVSLKQGETKLQQLKVKNTGTYSYKISIDLQNLADFITLDEFSFILTPGQVKVINLAFTAAESEIPDVYTGRILVKSDSVVKPVITIIEVRSKKVMFDVNLTIPETYSEVFAGEKVLSRVDIANLGELKPIDVALNYVIKDLEGNIVYIRDEMLALEDFVSIERLLPTPKKLKPDTYVVYVKVEYDGITATASDTFVVGERKVELPGKAALPRSAIIGGVILVAIVVLILLIVRKKKGDLKGEVNIIIGNVEKLLKKDVSAAESLYTKIKPLYEKLSVKEKEEVISRITRLYNEIRKKKNK